YQHDQTFSPAEKAALPARSNFRATEANAPARLQQQSRPPSPGSWTIPRRAPSDLRVLGSVRARDGAPAASMEEFMAVPKTRLSLSARPAPAPTARPATRAGADTPTRDPRGRRRP